MSVRPVEQVPVAARASAHPVFEDVRVVRLVQEPLVEASDAELAAVGLVPAENATGSAPPVVGRAPARAVGFPAWPILTDPDNAPHALALVGDLRRIERRAGSKPGAAAQLALDAAETLDGTAPHFLPTFYEEVARIFLTHDQPAQAGRFFSRARDVERTHALAIDEARHRQALLEFALAGALPVKALTAESKDLPSRMAPADALEEFLTLLIERTRAGLAPYAGAIADLGRLIRGAKLSAPERAQTEARLFDALLDAPALQRAAAGFWKSARDPLGAYLAARPDAADALFSEIPAEAEPADWLDLVERSGAADRLRDGSADPVVWIEGFLAHVAAWGTKHRSAPDSARGTEKLVALIETLPDLDGARLTVPAAIDRIPVRVLDAILDRGASTLHVAEPRRLSDSDRALDMEGWLADDARLPLDRLAADPEMRVRAALALLPEPGHRRSGPPRANPALVRALAQSPSGRAVIAQALEPDWSSDAHLRSRWMPDARQTRSPSRERGEGLLSADRAGRRRPTLAQAHARLPRLSALLAPDLLGLLEDACPEAIAALRRDYDPARLTASALRQGLRTELTWPAFEAAYAELARAHASDDGPPSGVGGPVEAFPAVGLWTTEGRVVFVDGARRVAEHVFDAPRGDEYRDFSFALSDGRILFSVKRSVRGKTQTVLRWSHQDREGVLDGGDWRAWNSDESMSIVVPGGRLTDVGLLRAGEMMLPEKQRAGAVVHDDGAFATGAGLALDPETGEIGAKRWPDAIAELLAPHDAEGYVVHAVRWQPVTETTADSLFDTHDGRHATVVLARSRSEGRLRGVTDERIIHADGSVDDLPDAERIGAGRLVRPGGGHWDVLDWHEQFADDEGFVVPTSLTRWGTPHAVHRTSLAGIHQLRVRDAAVSARMRTLTETDVAPLADAARAWVSGIDADLLPGPQDLFQAPAERTLPDELIAQAAAVLGTDDPALTEAAAWVAAEAAAVAERSGLAVDSREEEGP
ncbi:hypothetical protein [Microbacterium sp. gxy059]|uniref:hypothetical protein n=1 Tax=Microbacterium sp. gxy059 TaxID=2957199 RepID=UPI003D95C772